jgi:mannose-6-phosphate isomerase
MWHILRAAPGATIALGFQRAVTAGEARQAALSGEIERMLRLFPVSPGETYFIPAGTVHAIGAGVTICEIQQNSDITYRLYDYGRPRELHLERGVAAIDLASWRHPGPAAPTALDDGWRRLVSCRHFATDALELAGALDYRPGASRFELLIAVEGAGRFNGVPFGPGAVWLAPAGCGPIRIESAGELRMLRTFPP